MFNWSTRTKLSTPERERLSSRVTLFFLCFAAQLAMAQSTGSIQGRVTDASGAPVLGAVIIAEAADGTHHTTVSDIEGAFQISSLAVGNYNIRISANGLADWTALSVPASANPESTSLNAVLEVAALVTTVTVGAGPEEVATEQIKQELQQRVIGVIPNYYVTYDKNPAPLSPAQKLHLGVRTLVDPTTFAAVGITAGIEQKMNSYRDYGQGAAGFARRFGAAYGISVGGIMITAVAADSLFHQDPRYVYSGEGTRAQRAWYAVKSAFLARGDNGKWQPPYASIVGMVGSAELSQTYLPGSRTQYTLLGRSLMFRFAGMVGLNVAEEFFLKKATSNKPVIEAERLPVLREGTPVPLIAVEGFSTDSAKKGQTVSFVLTEDLSVDGNVVARIGDVASGQIVQVSSGKSPDAASEIGLERVTLRAGHVDVPLRSSQSRGSVGPMLYRELPESGKIGVTLYVARTVPFPEHS